MDKNVLFLWSTQLYTPCPAELFQLYFCHLKLELLTQFPASNDEKYHYVWKIGMSNIELLDQLSIYQKLSDQA